MEGEGSQVMMLAEACHAVSSVSNPLIPLRSDQTKCFLPSTHFWWHKPWLHHVPVSVLPALLPLLITLGTPGSPPVSFTNYYRKIVNPKTLKPKNNQTLKIRTECPIGYSVSCVSFDCTSDKILSRTLNSFHPVIYFLPLNTVGSCKPSLEKDTVHTAIQWQMPQGEE